MADFCQTGVVPTFHRLGELKLEMMEDNLREFNRHRPIALVLPVTPAELGSPALEGILSKLKDIDYLHEIVIVLGRTDKKEDLIRTKQKFSVLPQEHSVIWASGPPAGELYHILEEADLSAGDDGKGRSVWLAYGYILARDESKIIALHDCDIVNYSRELLARLCYPIASPRIEYAFCKGYYARVTDRLHGRVTRLFYFPLVTSLIRIYGHLPFLTYLESFRYPLAGEFSMITELAKINRIPADWGIEVETLAEVYRNYTLRRICQTEILETYEHKHQPLSAEDPTTGLMKMSIDIARAIFRNLAMEGIVMSESTLRTLIVNYQRTAKDYVKRYQDESEMNGLVFDFHKESLMAEAFTRALQMAGQKFLEDPLYSPHIPNWNRVVAAIPDFLDRLRLFVEKGR
jgi:glucosyl-3-phosphoglycerate synthase